MYAIRSYYVFARANAPKTFLQIRGGHNEGFRITGQASDKRWIHLNITSDGNKVLKKLDEFLRYDLIENTKYQNELESGLLHILTGIQKNNSYNTFGVCKTCRNFIKEGKDQFRCGLTKQVLTPSDSEKICVEHKYRRVV